MKNLSELKKGEKIDIHRFLGFTAGGDCSQYGAVITKVTTKYNEDTGKPYKVIWVAEWGFAINDEKNEGAAVTPPTVYYCTPSIK